MSEQPPIKILLVGSQGRMGRAISACATLERAIIADAVDVGDSLDSLVGSYDCLIDFSFREATLPAVQWAAKAKVPVVIGTTGHSDEDREAITALTEQIPMVWAGNYSVGVNLLNYLVSKAADVLGTDYDAEVIEMHHRHKKDAPSGTAEKLLEILLQARGLERDALAHGRSGITGERPRGQIGMHALRGGDVVGDHTVLFAGEGERVELTHKASDRSIFATGALRAAHWVIGREPGLYHMQDVLGLHG